METTIQKSVNGFRLDAIQETVKTLTQNPELAQFKFRAKNRWIVGGHNRSTIHGFYGGGQEDESRITPFVFDNGEPPILLGNNEGANPVEFILHGLAGCTTTTMALHAAAKGIAVESIESELEGDLDVMGFLGLNENVRNGYQEIRIKFTITGDLTGEQKEELISFAKNSPVYDVVTHGVPVKFSVK
jgi:uncharacterized OsmC-like protein